MSTTQDKALRRAATVARYARRYVKGLLGLDEDAPIPKALQEPRLYTNDTGLWELIMAIVWTDASEGGDRDGP